jgi:hypothetical protein
VAHIDDGHRRRPGNRHSRCFRRRSRQSSRPTSQSVKMTKQCESSILTPLSEKWLRPNPRLSS